MGRDDPLDGGVVPARSSLKDREFYLTRAYVNAFGQRDESAWNPALGYRANRPRILKLYKYYEATYLRFPPPVLLWAGLGKLAGAAVVGGLDVLTTFPGSLATPDPGPLTNTMVEIGKAIFHDLAWQHEALLDDKQRLIALAKEQDVQHPARRSYEEAWKRILNFKNDDLIEGNRALLENEQWTIIQPRYDTINASTEGIIFRRTRAFTSNIHPYHKDFSTSPGFQAKDVIVAQDRWDWITDSPHGMWAKWAEFHPEWGPVQRMPDSERLRLVQLDLVSELIPQRWGSIPPVIKELLVPGGP